MIKKLFLHGFLLLGLSFSLYSQDTLKVTDLVTDRPDQTESSVIVPVGLLQIETGYLHESVTSDISNTLYNSTLLRYGFTENLEIRFGVGYLKNVEEPNIGDAGIITKGLIPLLIGSKLYVAEEKGIWPEVAFCAGFSLPESGSSKFKTSYLAPILKILASHTISPNLSIGYNIGAVWDGETARATGIYTVSAGMSVYEGFGIFIENYAFFRKGFFDNRIDAGITWLLRKNLQLDLSGGLGLNNKAPNGFISFGFSWRVPH